MCPRTRDSSGHVHAKTRRFGSSARGHATFQVTCTRKVNVSGHLLNVSGYVHTNTHRFGSSAREPHDVSGDAHKETQRVGSCPRRNVSGHLHVNTQRVRSSARELPTFRCIRTGTRNGSGHMHEKPQRFRPALSVCASWFRGQLSLLRFFRPPRKDGD